MGVEEFFNAIRERCSSEEEYAIELLKARGFLLEDKGLVLSDNSHPRDEAYLGKILRERNLGDVNEGRIILSPGGNLEELFFVDNKIGVTASYGICEDWKRFVHDKFSPKISISLLEPFVARYIKAISACGVKTYLSCDGNHPESRPPHNIIVECEGPPSHRWHIIICKRCLSARFNLRWNEDYSRIRIRERDKWSTYIELNRAAAFLYHNRVALRGIRWAASETISNSMARHWPYEELSAIFSDRAIKLLDKIALQAVRDR